MALRAGYYGVKRRIKDKIEEITGIWDTTIASIFPRSEEAVLGARNLLPNEGVTQTISGVTFTKYDDGTVKANGTATARVNYQWLTNETAEKILTPFIGRKVRLSGSINGAVPNKYWLSIQSMYGDAAGANQSSNTLEFIVPDFTNYTTRPNGYIAVANGVTVNNVVFKPMLTLASDSNSGYDNYLPYAMTNRDLTLRSDDLKTDVNGILSAASSAADFTAFKTALGALTPVTRSISLIENEVREEITEEPVKVTKRTTKKSTTKNEEV